MVYLIIAIVLCVSQTVQAQTTFDVASFTNTLGDLRWNLSASNGGSGNVTLTYNHDGTSTFNMVGIIPVWYDIGVHVIGTGCRAAELDQLMTQVVTNQSQANYVVLDSEVAGYRNIQPCIDTDGDGIDDVDDPDDDNDGIPDPDDPCPLDATNACDPCPGSQDADGDGICDNDPCNGQGGDTDGDGTCDGTDPCPDDVNDTCNPCPSGSQDVDGDGVCDDEPCNGQGGDGNEDGICDDDPCNGLGGDTDADGVCDDDDECPEDSSDSCDPCDDRGGDADEDGCCADSDCDDSNPNKCRICEDCDPETNPDADGDGCCADTDCDDADPYKCENCDCTDSDEDGVCDEDDCEPFDPTKFLDEHCDPCFELGGDSDRDGCCDDYDHEPFNSEVCEISECEEEFEERMTELEELWIDQMPELDINQGDAPSVFEFELIKPGAISQNDTFSIIIGSDLTPIVSHYPQASYGGMASAFEGMKTTVRDVFTVMIWYLTFWACLRLIK